MASKVTAPQLKLARELLGLSQTQVARLLGRSAAMASVVERGRGGQAAVARLLALYEAAGISFLPDGQVQLKGSSRVMAVGSETQAPTDASA